MAIPITLSERRETRDNQQGSARATLPSTAAEVSGQLILRDGGCVRFRPIQPDDGERLQAFHGRLSPESIEFRYFHPVPALSPEWVARLVHVDGTDRMALVATTTGGSSGRDATEQMIAVVRYERLGPTTAEVAFLVEDRWQGHGIATQLLYRLAAYAARRGFKTFVAEIMGTNNAMRDLVRCAGFPYTTTYETGSVQMRLDITSPPSGPFAPAPGARG